MRVERDVTDENWINSSIEFNDWLKENADHTKPHITLLDTSKILVSQAASIVDSWIVTNLQTNCTK